MLPQTGPEPYRGGGCYLHESLRNLQYLELQYEVDLARWSDYSLLPSGNEGIPTFWHTVCDDPTIEFRRSSPEALK